jgi:hypothetical protein
MAFDNYNQNTESLCFLRKSIIQMMKLGNFVTAAQLLRNIIEANVSAAESEEFIGLGSKAEEEGFSESKGYEWYE